MSIQQTGQGGTARVTVWTALAGLIGGLLGGGGESILHWLEFGQHLNETQQKAVLDVVRLATDLDHENNASAVEYIKILGDSGEFPMTVTNRLLVLAARSSQKTNPSPEALIQVANSFPVEAQNLPELKQLVMPGHPRVFLQIAQADQRDSAKGFIDRASVLLPNAKFPGTELVRSYNGDTEFRYFFPEDKSEADAIFAQVQKLLPGIPCKRIGGYENRQGVRPELFEIWFAPGQIALTDPNSRPAPKTCPS